MVIILGVLAACGPSIPDIEGEITAQSRAAPYPKLIPLAPDMFDANLSAAPENDDVLSQAADLRARARALQNRSF
jgi:hypothetical protein